MRDNLRHNTPKKTKKMEKFLLSTYLIKIQNKSKNDQILSRFNETEDFFNYFQIYLNDIFKSIVKTSDSKNSVPLHLTLDSIPTVDIEKRTIYGYFSAGISGEQYNVLDPETRERVAEIKKNHAAFRELFFYVKIPKNKDFASLILQRKSKFGIKTVLLKTLNNHFREKGYLDYYLFINNIVHGRVYRQMMDNGKLKKVDLIKRRLPNSIEEYFENGNNSQQIPGVLKTSMVSSTGLPQNYKKFVDYLFTHQDKERIEIVDTEFDEVEFELELNGKKKTFYVMNKSRIQPDIDVSSELVYNIDGSANIESLIAQSEELIKDLIELRITNDTTN